LKIMVGIVVLSFFGVVVVLTIEGLNWGAVFKGLIPNFSLLTNPAPTLQPAIEATGEFAAHWQNVVANVQRDKIITAFATAVGINMTFLLPYSMLKKKWGTEHRQLAIVDLSIGLVIPFVLATGCVVIAAASQFHNQHQDVFEAIDNNVPAKSVGEYKKQLNGRIMADESLAPTFGPLMDELKKKDITEERKAEVQAEINAFYPQLPEADRMLAAKIAARGNLKLADTLAPLAGKQLSQKIFGVGVLGMALSTIIILMLINGFAICEMLGKEPEGMTHRIGSTLPGIIGISGPFIWAGAAAALATPTSVAGGAMLPIAYFTFLLLMNSKAVLGDARPEGKARIIWNILMGTATVVATFGSIWGIWGKAFAGIPFGKIGVAVLVVLFIVGTLGYIKNEKKAG
ncbi:MAG: divalent metal cation transporter, partial [Verrucomicrobiota bacterium]